ncbi:MAG: Cys-tRNA(Pro) deacylase [Candidatus Nanopelagicales bacterium]
MARKSSGSTGTPATKVLADSGMAHVLRPYRHDPRSQSYGAEAAQELGVEPERVFKTLLADVDGALVVGVVPVNAQLDLKLLASAVGGKRAAMAEVARAERATGYVAGGISPLGQRNEHPTVIDDSALEHATVLVSGGRRGLDIELSPGNLITLTNARIAPIARRA